MTLQDFDIWYRARYNRTSSTLTSTAFIISDLLAVLLSFAWGFFWVRIYGFINDYDSINAKSFITYWPYLPAFIVIFQILKLYPGVSLAPSEEIRRFTIGSLLAYGAIIMSRLVEYGVWDSINTAFLISCGFSAIILLTSRDFAHFFLFKTKLGGIPAVIFRANETGRLVVDRLLNSSKAGYTPVLILDDDPEQGDEYLGIPIIHNTMIGPEIVKAYNIKMAIVTMTSLSHSSTIKMMNFSVSAFRYSVLIPVFSNVSNIWMSVRDFDGILGFATTHRLKMKWNLAIKRTLDIAIVGIGGLILLPFLLVIGLLIKATSPGPILYHHRRLGLNGAHFKAYKFRSMILNADKQLETLLAENPELKKEWDADQKLKNDPRVTKIGKFLRRTSFDEFPQLLNILKGQMSLVGPRPIVEEEVKKYGENFSRIFSVKPGLTGLWQISGRSDTNYMGRISYDTYYLQSWSVWLDLWILYRTPGVILKGRGAY